MRTIEMRAWRQIGSPTHIARSTPLNWATRTQVLAVEQTDARAAVSFGNICSRRCSRRAFVTVLPGDRVGSRTELHQHSDSAEVSRRNLLDQPGITVGILEGEVRPVARVLEVRAGEAPLLGKRRSAASQRRSRGLACRQDPNWLNSTGCACRTRRHRQQCARSAADRRRARCRR